MFLKRTTPYLCGAFIAHGLFGCIDKSTPCEEHPANCIDHPTITRDLGDVESFYKSFESDEEAATFYAQVDEQVVAAILGRQPVVPLDFSDARYGKLNDIAAEVHGVFTSLYPALSVLPPPRIVILPVAEPNAAAVMATELSEQKLPNLFFVNEGMLERLDALAEGERDPAYAGLIAHELAHLYMRHGTTEVLDQITQAYFQDPAEDEALGYQQAFPGQHPELSAKIRNYQAAAQKFGMHSGEEFSGLRPGPTVNSMLLELMEPYEGGPGDCAAAYDATDAWVTFVNDTTAPSSVLGEVIPFTAAQTEEGIALSTELLELARSCLRGEPPRYLETAAASYGLPPTMENLELVRQSFPPEFEQIYLSADNNIDRMLALASVFIDDLESMGAELDPTMRLYMKEEEADDVAMMIETELSARYQSTQAGGSIESLFRGPNSELPDTCEDSLAMDKAPEYNLWNDHHSTCYRIFHARRIKRVLTQAATSSASLP